MTRTKVLPVMLGLCFSYAKTGNVIIGVVSQSNGSPLVLIIPVFSFIAKYFFASPSSLKRITADLSSGSLTSTCTTGKPGPAFSGRYF